MSEIKVNNSGFETAKQEQKRAVNELWAIYQKQKSIFSTMKSGWKGSSGDAFKRGSNEILCESLVAQLTLSDLNKKTLYAEKSLQEADVAVKNAIAKK